MSMMYGKRRVVLSTTPTHLGNYLVIICGSEKPGSGGDYHPLGYWYKEEGLFYVDLKSREQLYDSVGKETIGCKHLGGLPTKKALREFVMTYYVNQQEAQ